MLHVEGERDSPFFVVWRHGACREGEIDRFSCGGVGHVEGEIDRFSCGEGREKRVGQ